jgi:hypothetical protein
MLISVGQVFVIPYVVVIVAFNICSVLLRFLDLSSCRSAHPLLHHLILKQFEYPVFLLLLPFLSLDLFLLCPFIVLLSLLSLIFLDLFCMYLLLYHYLNLSESLRLILVVLGVHGLKVLHLQLFDLRLTFSIVLTTFVLKFLLFQLLFRESLSWLRFRNYCGCSHIGHN